MMRYVEEIICGAALVTMVILVIANVSLRYLFGTAIPWAEEVATICFVWSVFIGASATYKHKMDIGIDALVKKLSLSGQQAARRVVLVILLLLNGYIFYMAIVFTSIAWDKPTAVLGVSSAVFNSALVVGFGLISLHSVRFLLQEFRQQDSGEIAS